MSEETHQVDITGLLRRWQAGDNQAYDSVVEWAYQRMMAIAAGLSAGERESTEPAALVHEAYLRLRKLQRMEWRDRQHFFACVASEMRRVLVDQARARLASKREGAYQRTPLSDDLAWVDARSQDVLDLDRALVELEHQDAEKARLVELRYVMGCTVPEISELQGASGATIERHLRFARTWLFSRLHPEGV